MAVLSTPHPTPTIVVEVTHLVSSPPPQMSTGVPSPLPRAEDVTPVFTWPLDEPPSAAAMTGLKGYYCIFGKYT